MSKYIFSIKLCPFSFVIRSKCISQKEIVGLKAIHVEFRRQTTSRFLIRHFSTETLAKNVKSDSKADESGSSIDFLSNHGGKIALVSLAAAVGLIYRWIKSGRDKTALEEKILHDSALEPVEVNELRYLNQWSTDDFKSILNSEINSSEYTYQEFISIIRNHKNIHGGHLFDRVVSYFVDSFHPMKADNSNQVQPDQPKFPIHLLLIMLLMAVQSPSADDKVTLLYEIGKKYISNNPSHDMTTANRNDNDINTEYQLSEIDYGLNSSTVQTLITDLNLSCQVPSEKRVIETGSNWPYKTHRIKVAHEMLSDARTSSFKPPHQSNNFTEEDLKTIILGGQVCAWGECYRHK